MQARRQPWELFSVSYVVTPADTKRQPSVSPLHFCFGNKASQTLTHVATSFWRLLPPPPPPTSQWGYALAADSAAPAFGFYMASRDLSNQGHLMFMTGSLTGLNSPSCLAWLSAEPQSFSVLCLPSPKSAGWISSPRACFCFLPSPSIGSRSFYGIKKRVLKSLSWQLSKR